MNIAVLTAEGKVIVRTDNTLVRDSADFYVPDFVRSVRISPVVFVEISSPCRCCDPKFASRHLGLAGAGALLHCCDEESESACIDRTTYISGPRIPYAEIGGKELRFTGRTIGLPSRETIEDAFGRINSRVYLRTGDLICIELEAPSETGAGSAMDCILDGEESFSFELR